MYHYKECGLDGIYLKNGYNIVNTAYGKSVGIHDIDHLHEAIAKGLLDKAGPLSGREFRFLRLELELSQKAIGQLMDKSDQTVAAWEKGGSDIPLLADAAIRNLYSERVSDSPIAGLLEDLAALDRQRFELRIELEEVDSVWKQSDALECA